MCPWLFFIKQLELTLVFFVSMYLPFKCFIPWRGTKVLINSFHLKYRSHNLFFIPQTVKALEHLQAENHVF